MVKILAENEVLAYQFEWGYNYDWTFNGAIISGGEKHVDADPTRTSVGLINGGVREVFSICCAACLMGVGDFNDKDFQLR